MNSQTQKNHQFFQHHIPTYPSLLSSSVSSSSTSALLNPENGKDNSRSHKDSEEIESKKEVKFNVIAKTNPRNYDIADRVSFLLPDDIIINQYLYQRGSQADTVDVTCCPLMQFRPILMVVKLPNACIGMLDTSHPHLDTVELPCQMLNTLQSSYARRTQNALQQYQQQINSRKDLQREIYATWKDFHFLESKVQQAHRESQKLFEQIISSFPVQKKREQQDYHKNAVINNNTTPSTTTTWVDQLNDCDSSIIQEIQNHSSEETTPKEEDNSNDIFYFHYKKFDVRSLSHKLYAVGHSAGFSELFAGENNQTLASQYMKKKGFPTYLDARGFVEFSLSLFERTYTYNTTLITLDGFRVPIQGTYTPYLLSQTELLPRKYSDGDILEIMHFKINPKIIQHIRQSRNESPHILQNNIINFEQDIQAEMFVQQYYEDRLNQINHQRKLFEEQQLKQSFVSPLSMSDESDSFRRG